MKRLCVVVAAIGFLLALGGCASMPTWEGMSEAEISEWQKLGIDAETANTFREADLNPENVKSWYAAGITDADTILSWHGKGFSSNEAAERSLSRKMSLFHILTFAQVAPCSQLVKGQDKR